MKKFIKWSAIICGALVVLCCGIGLILPNTWSVETSVVIDAGPEAIYPHIATPRRFVTYTEAYARTQPEMADTKFEYEFGDIEQGAGAWWVSKSEGSRVRIEISRSDQMQGIWYDGAIEQDEVNDHGSITFEAVEDGSKTKVTWKDDGELPPIIGGLLSSVVETTLEPFFHGTLLEIKKAVEAGE